MRTNKGCVRSWAKFEVSDPRQGPPPPSPRLHASRTYPMRLRLLTPDRPPHPQVKESFQRGGVESAQTPYLMQLLLLFSCCVLLLCAPVIVGGRTTASANIPEIRTPAEYEGTVLGVIMSWADHETGLANHDPYTIYLDRVVLDMVNLTKELSNSSNILGPCNLRNSSTVLVLQVSSNLRLK